MTEMDQQGLEEGFEKEGPARDGEQAHRPDSRPGEGYREESPGGEGARNPRGGPGSEDPGVSEEEEPVEPATPKLAHPRRELSHPIKILLVTGGFIAFIVGIIGLLIPVFPTSPFIILAAALFFRGSDRWYEWILNHRWFGRYVRDYRERNGMARVPKYLFLTTVWTAVGVSTVVVLDGLWPRIFLLAFGAALSAWVLRLKTL